MVLPKPPLVAPSWCQYSFSFSCGICCLCFASMTISGVHCRDCRDLGQHLMSCAIPDAASGGHIDRNQRHLETRLVVEANDLAVVERQSCGEVTLRVTLLAVAQHQWSCAGHRAACHHHVWTLFGRMPGGCRPADTKMDSPRAYMSADLLVVGSNTYCSCTRAAQLISCHAIGERALRCKAICLCGPCV